MPTRRWLLPTAGAISPSPDREDGGLDPGAARRGRSGAAGGAARAAARVLPTAGAVAAVVDPLAQLLAYLEGGQTLGLHVHRLAGAGVAALVGLVLPDGEAAEAADLDPLAPL